MPEPGTASETATAMLRYSFGTARQTATTILPALEGAAAAAALAMAAACLGCSAAAVPAAVGGHVRRSAGDGAHNGGSGGGIDSDRALDDVNGGGLAVAGLGLGDQVGCRGGQFCGRGGGEGFVKRIGFGRVLAEGITAVKKATLSAIATIVFIDVLLDSQT